MFFGFLQTTGELLNNLENCFFTFRKVRIRKPTNNIPVYLFSSQQSLGQSTTWNRNKLHLFAIDGATCAHTLILNFYKINAFVSRKGSGIKYGENRWNVDTSWLICVKRPIHTTRVILGHVDHDILSMLRASSSLPYAYFRIQSQQNSDTLI